MKALITVSAAALISLAGHGYWLNQARITEQVLDACAKEQNVYACHMVPKPTEEPRVEYRQAAILPPPVM